MGKGVLFVVVNLKKGVDAQQDNFKRKIGIFLLLELKLIKCSFLD